MKAEEKKKILETATTPQLVMEMLQRREFIHGLIKGAASLAQSDKVPPQLKFAYGKVAEAADLLDAYAVRFKIDEGETECPEEKKN